MRFICEWTALATFIYSFFEYRRKHYEAAIYLVLAAIMWVKLWQIGGEDD